MQLFGTILAYILALAPKIVLGIETVYGDAKAGDSKKKMAQDALTAAAQGAASVIAPGTDEAAEAQLAATAVGTFLQVFDPISDAVNSTRSSGAYQNATAAAATTQKAAASLKAAAHVDEIPVVAAKGKPVENSIEDPLDLPAEDGETEKPPTTA